ncbi:MAG: sulfite exporter TauE/SafE family protein [Nitrososphaerales archaeon]
MVLAGIVMGTYGAMIGAGGGLIAVPFLILVLLFAPETAVGTSLFMTLFVAISASIAFLRQGRVDKGLALRFSVFTIPGSIVGAFIVDNVELTIFRVLFGVLMIASAVYLLLGRENNTNKSSTTGRIRVLKDSSGQVFEFRVKMFTGYMLSFLIGFASSFFGVGGGIIMVPVMIGILGVPAQIAIATSQLIIVITASGGTLTHFQLGNIALETALPLTIGGVLGAQIGAKAIKKAKGRSIRILLSAGLAVLGGRLIFAPLLVSLARRKLKSNLEIG